MKKTLATKGSSGVERMVEKMQFPRIEIKSNIEMEGDSEGIFGKGINQSARMLSSFKTV